MKSLDAKHNRRRRGRQRFLLFPLLLMGMLLLGFHLWRHGLPHPDGPRIGLSVSDDWLDRLGIHRGAYDHVLSRVGAQVVTLEPRKGLEEVNALLESIDGLLLTGGGDVHPALYDGSLPPPHPPPASRGGMAVSLERDVFEIQLIRGALERDMPILGICRGHQILNVAHGGTLQGVRENEALAKNHGPSLKSFGAHLVEVVPNSYLANIMAENALQVNSFHLQAVAKLGVNLRASAIAPDGVIEAIERPDRRMVIGIQWHPEIMSIGDASHLAIFRKLVECAADYRAQRAKFANQQMRETAKKPIAKQTGKTLHLILRWTPTKRRLPLSHTAMTTMKSM